MAPLGVRTAVLLVAFLGACSSSADAPADTREQAPADPPGAASVLSLGQEIGGEEKSAYDRARDCSVALTITARTLAPMVSGADSREIQLINSAANRFRSIAERESSAGPSRVATEVERLAVERRDDRQGQAQLSIACLRQFESPS